MKFQFRLTVKQGPTTLARIQGLPRPLGALTVADVEQVVEIEQALERLLGFRIHLDTEAVK